jgi:hypothetical protein
MRLAWPIGRRSGIPGPLTRRCAWPDVASLLLVSLAIAVPIWTLWRPGVINEDDMLMAVYRLFELDKSWQEGVIFPRIALGLNFGYGGPLFQYYPPLATYLALPFHWVGLGWIEATKAVFTLGLLAAALGAYAYARWLLSEPRAALVVAAAYGLAPYLVLNTLERGALAELTALALLPWLFWAMHGLLRAPSSGKLWIAAILVALSVLAHNVTTLFVIPFLAVYVILLAWREQAWRRLPHVALALALGLGLSAFYWLPAFAERGFARIQEAMLSDGYHPDQNLRALTDAVQPSLAFNYWRKTHFRLALWQGVVLVAGIVAIPLAPPKLRFHLAVTGGLAAIALLLQLDPSRSFWQTAPLVQFIQFPWRLLGLTSFFVALLLGWLLCWRRLPDAGAWAVGLALVLLIVYAGVRYLEPKRLPAWLPMTSSQISTQDLYERGARDYALYSDYTPVWMKAAASDLAHSRPAEASILVSGEAAPTVAVLSESPGDFRLQVHAAAPFTLRLPRIYFPDWQVLVNGAPMHAGPEGRFGLVTTALPAGDYQVVARFVDTPVRRVAELTSALCLLALVVTVLWSHRGALRIGLAFAAMVAVFLGLYYGPTHAGHQPKPITANFNEELSLLGYDLEGAAVRPGDTLKLRLFWLTRQTPAKDYNVLISLVEPDDSGEVANDDSPPNFGYSPTSRWDPGGITVDEHQVSIDADMPPGTYRLVASVRASDNAQNLPVTLNRPADGANAVELLPGDRIVLGEVEVKDS